MQIPTAPRMTEAGRDRCTALWNTFSVKCTTEEEEDTNPKKDVKEAVRAPSTKRALGTWRVLGCGGDTAAPLAKGFIYVLRPSILIKSLWVLHHHGGGRVESLVKK